MPNQIRPRRHNPFRMNSPSQSNDTSSCVNLRIPAGFIPMLLSNLIVSVTIALAGVVTFLLQRSQDHALILIWPAGGIALAAVILKGPLVAPGIFFPLWVSCLMGGEGTFCSSSSANLKACTGCRSVRYCGRECQRGHWKAQHKTDCTGGGGAAAAGGGAGK